MPAAPDETRAWSSFKWAGVIVVIFGVQAGLMLWLGGRAPASVPADQPALEVRVPEHQAAVTPGAGSPLLLVTPNRNGFSSVWLRASEITNQPAEWNGQPDGTLPQPLNPPGDEIVARVDSGSAQLVSVLDRPKPALKTVGIPPNAISESTFDIEGDLARRTLLARPALVSPVSDAALSNSIVEIDVNADGLVVDPAVIPPGGSSSSAETDAYARSIAMSLQFKPLPRASLPAERTWGRVVFQWRTLPAPATNNLSP